MANIPLGDNAVSVLQALNQYITGLTGGYLVDLLIDQIHVDEDNLAGKMGKQLLQAALNGVALHYMLRYVHGPNPISGYRDPTGGYMLALGLIQAQPTFMHNGKQLFKGLTLFVRNQTEKEGNTAATVSDTTMQVSP